MKAKEKANELADKLVKSFMRIKVQTIGCNDGGNPCIINNNMTIDSAKQCALILVDEIQNAIMAFDEGMNKEMNYWQEVKEEINKL